MLNKELYRQVYASYRQWNHDELVDRARNAGSLSPERAWQQYVALVEFAWKLCPQPSQWQQAQKAADLARYYERVQKMEAWRRARGKTT